MGAGTTGRNGPAKRIPWWRGEYFLTTSALGRRAEAVSSLAGPVRRGERRPATEGAALPTGVAVLVRVLASCATKAFEDRRDTAIIGVLLDTTRARAVGEVVLMDHGPSA